MRIMFTGGGTGGHIYPLLAVADEIKRQAKEPVEMTYIGPRSPLNTEFSSRGIRIFSLLSSKLRRYAAIDNLLDVPKFFISIFQALLWLYIEMPDVLFSKGGPGAFAAVLAAWFYRIPIIIHESDAVPGLTNRLSSFFATKIALSFASASESFSQKKIAVTGNPIRPGILADRPPISAAKKDLGLNPDLPLLVVLGGSQGSRTLNAFIIENLKELLAEVQIFHQYGPANGRLVEDLLDSPLKSLEAALWVRYKSVPYLELPELVRALAAADLVLSRAGSGAIFEIASFGKSSLLVPLPGSANDHQRANAYEYATAGAAAVFEENNLAVHLVLGKIKELLTRPERKQKMEEAAKRFFIPDAAEIIAKETLLLGWR